MKWLLLVSISLWGTGVLAQQQFVVSGTILEKGSARALTGATVAVAETATGAVADESGRFRLLLPGGDHRLVISFLGYRTLDTLLRVSSDKSLELYLAEGTIAAEGVTITAEAAAGYVQSAQMSEISLSNFEISSLPALLGEADPIRLLQLTPGVQSGTESGVGMYVRGGGVDQNLVLFDHSVIYNPGHLMGFFSVFNPDVISNVRLIKSGMPARYGGRVSSVIQASSYKGYSDSLEVKGQIGLISSRLTVNSSLDKGRGSFIISARQAYPDLFVKPVIVPFLKDASGYFINSRYHFYDYNAGFSYRIGPKDYLSVSAMYGRDQYSMDREAVDARNSLNWGNAVASARWNHIVNQEYSLSNSLSFSAYDFDLSGAQAAYLFSMMSSVTDFRYAGRLSRYAENHSFKAGTELVRHAFTPNKIDVVAGSLVADFIEYNRLHAWEGGLYFDDEFRVTENLHANAGLRYSFFNQVGPYVEYLRDETTLITDTVHYPRGESLAFYHQLEPRLSMRYRLSPQSSIKASYMHVAQYVHLATSSSVSLPMDIWFPSSKNTPPQVGDQVSLGYFRDLFDSRVETSLEVYYKHTRNQLEFINGIINNSVSMTLEENIAVGRGISYGTELYVRKHTGSTTGWISYTLSRSERQFENINEGKIYPAKYDRKHDLSVAAIHRINELWNASAVFIFVSGNALTIPVGRYIIQGNLVNEYGKVNQFRMPPYHRLDLSATRTRKTGRGFVSSWDFSVYNVYSRANPFYLFFETEGDIEEYQLKVDPVLVSLFPVVPSISWRFRF